MMAHPTPTTPKSRYVSGFAAQRVTGREREILPVNLVPEPLLPAKPEQPHGRLGKEAGKEG